MIEPSRKISLQELQQVNYEMVLPFQLQLEQHIIECHKLLRIVPGKRLVFLGQMADKPIIIKLFIHQKRAKKHWSRELAGSKLLLDNQILTPDLIAQGISEEGIYFLVFSYIEGQDLSLFWKKNNNAERIQKLMDMMSVLSQHHKAGLAHQDLHYANFLIDEDNRAYTLDGEEVKTYSSPLNKKRSLKNLALFLAQTFDLEESSCHALLQHYAQVSSIVLKEKDLETFWWWIKDFHQQRIEQYLKKVLRECTEVVFEKRKSGYTLCRREYHNNEFKKLLEQPEVFFQNDHSIYLKKGNTCTVKSVQVAGNRYVIKRYNPKGIMYELVHKGQISRARKSWINAHLLQFMGIKTPEPIALIEQQPALGKRCSYFICRQVDGQSSWDYFCETEHSKERKQKVADALVSTLKQLCEQNITHGDLKGSNFLIENDTVWIIDLDGLNQHKKQKNFAKAWQKDKRRFLKNWDKKKCYAPWKHYFNQIFIQENVN